MPQQQRRPGRPRRLLAVSVVSTGAMALVVLNAPQAAAAGAPKPCPKGTDPASTIDNWKCQLDNIREGLQPKQPDPTPSPSPTKSTKPPQKKKPGESKPKAPGHDSGSSGGRSGTGGRAVPPVPPGPVPQTGESRPLTTADAPEIPGMLPAPQVATGPQNEAGPATRTRLTAPVAASERQNDPTTLWVAAAAGAAGAVGALNLSVLGRTLRRPRGHG
ncbi:hypothetical protein [Actinomadura rugatobispora]|uniref:Uncharacterized protein n=1 Tax=Actinomadura rugatobispora TaxID=1994 RepID=A0ABW1A4T5_9ACTN|nr:hypothetical protein GCM10010200_088700 [Actinomadura rugatobispora]